ncbi:unnamed protein product [Rotaria sordida]|uniref:Uncharacterized protein n=1 Tax=Rotaria sordida TaxID=392033 RepID=A0A815FKJ9_9BILA|nr:unnamed protein product [Rotaria sordida]CAF1321177.1 unnamed protein product [Rotaria sordida]CAF1326624.1 unnamed protein product [Rotaria sordida]CAF3741884.1 unnamed protein product [Rotaria sordida]CAF3884592.1 unnamed protein product [Rotaria sordida]
MDQTNQQQQKLPTTGNIGENNQLTETINNSNDAPELHDASGDIKTASGSAPIPQPNRQRAAKSKTHE